MSWIKEPGWRGHLSALLAGALTPLAFAPFGYWPLLLLGIALFYLGLSQVAVRRAVLRGWCYGFGLFLTGTGWVYVSIHDYGGASPPLAGLLTLGLVAGLGSLFALFGGLWATWLRSTQAPLRDALTFAALWLAVDAFRSWFLTGFPWLYAGYSQLDGPLAGLIPLGGVWLASFLVVLSATLLARLPALRQRPAALALGLVLLLTPWFLGQYLKGHLWTQAAGDPLRVVAVQGNVPQIMKWDPQQVSQQLQLYRDLTLANADQADLVVWPENAIPLIKSAAQDYLDGLQTFSQQQHLALITGLPVDQPGPRGEPRFYNGITVLGEGQGTYLKQKLVPFGEYVPLEDLLRGLINFFDLPMSDFSRGPRAQPPLLAQGHRIAPLICYEVIFPEFAADQAAHSELLLTISNDTWFGHSIGPLQHLQMAQTRALESGRWMIRATNNGVTALIDPTGKVTRRLPQFETAVLHGSVLPMQGQTPYLRWRFWPLALLCALLLGWTLAARKKPQPASEQPTA